jgi:hypothetical protein
MKKLFLIFSLIIILGCDNESLDNNNNVVVTESSDCKSKIQVLDSNKTIVKWNYDGENLYFKRINSGFNCGAQKLEVNMGKAGSLITLTEKGIGPLADCSCLFDFDYTVKGISIGTYTIKIVEPLVDSYREEYKISFEIDLNKDTSGEFSQFRNFYPWMGM